jgi:WD40 repeat protein
MLFRCNILALVGGGRNPRYQPNKVMIWDDHQSRCIGELSFRSEVKAVKLRRDRVVVVLEHKIYVYNFADLKLVDHIETIANPKGLCALCPYSSNTVLVCPGLQKGHVRVELYDQKATKVIPAHEGALACFALNFDGTRLATASEKGTLIRIWDTASGEPLQELRRGANAAEIFSICFNYNSQFLATSSDKGTIHIFSLGAPQPNKEEVKNDDKKDDPANNRKSSLFFLKGVLPKYFSSEWSFAQFRVADARTIVAFGHDKNTVIIVSAEGSFYRVTFDPEKGGECHEEYFFKFIQGPESQ